MTHHGAALRALGVEPAVVSALARDFRTAPLDACDRALCAFAEKLTLAPHTVSKEDVDTLMGHGFTPRAVADACMIVAYFNFVNRLALGLGVELESYWRPEEVLQPFEHPGGK